MHAWWLVYVYVPEQATKPSPVKPASHEQVWEPSESVHVAFLTQLCVPTPGEGHSLISEVMMRDMQIQQENEMFTSLVFNLLLIWFGL